MVRFSDEEWKRPIPDQIASVRHYVQGVDQRVVLMHSVYEKLVKRVEGIEDRQTVMEAALPIADERIAAIVGNELDRRTEAARAERREDLKQVFGSTKTAALYITTVGQAVLMFGVFLHYVLGWSL